MRVTAEYEALSKLVASAVAEQLRNKPDSCFGLPSGNSPLGCYKILAQMSGQGELDWSHAKCFMLDDYTDGPTDLTFQDYLTKNLFHATNLPIENRFNPRLVDDYDQKIASLGGLDLTLLGIGANGHIAFNEPGTPVESWTHSVFLDESTREANRAYYNAETVIPRRAITMGLQTILLSKSIILIASGKNKRRALEKALSGKLDPQIPASILTTHKHLSVVSDFEYTAPSLSNASHAQ